MATQTVRRRLAVGVTVMGTAVVTGLTGAAAPAAAAGSPPPLALEATRTTVTGFLSDGKAYFDTGVYAVAGAKPFEVRAHRTSYAKLVRASRVQPGTDQVLPDGSVDEQFGGLTKFVAVTVTDQHGKVVSRKKQSFCPNGFEAVRRRPDAPATSPYPEGCYAGTPYALGAVYGLQAGYATPVGYSSAKLKVGTYTATVVIAKQYRDLFGIDAADATTTVTVNVVKDDPGAARLQARSRAADSTLPAPTARPRGAASTPSGPLPDLRSLPAWGIDVRKGRYLEFSATVWNGGPGRLVVDGFRQPADENLMDAYQYFFDAAGHQVGFAPVGTMEWDARDGHEHWHFTDFATYQLLDRHKNLVVRSQKEAFCLANTDAVDYTVPGANWKPENTDLHTACGGRESIGVREVLETGSGDTYVQSLPGQSFDLKGLKNGVYYIEVRANPVAKLFEASTANNVAYRKVTVSGKKGHRKVEAAKVGIISERF